MSGLTSSAVGGRKAAPRAPPRRRNVAADTTASSPITITTTEKEPTGTLETGGDEVPSHNTRTRRRAVSASPADIEHPAHVLTQTGHYGVDHNEALAEASNQPTDRTEHEASDEPRAGSVRLRDSRKRALDSTNGPSSTPTVTNKRARLDRSNDVGSTEAQQSVPQQMSTTDVRNGSSEVIVAKPAGVRTRRQVPTPAAAQTTDGDASQAHQRNTRRKPRRVPRPAESVSQDRDVSAEVMGEDEPDSDENHEIDPATLSMYDLSRDTKHGKTSEREKKMAKIDWAEVKRKRFEEAEAIVKGEAQPEKDGVNVMPSTEGANGTVRNEDAQDDGENSSHLEPTTRASGGGVRFRIVGGQLVEDESSLTIDRAARVAEAAAQSGDAVEEENDLTIRFNRTTYINARKRDPTERVPLWRSKSDAWSDEETDRFYDALRMFGTDFFIISKMFSPRTRKQIKLKFVREERLEPDRINAALLGKHTRRIDLDEYAQAINKDVSDFHKYDSLDHANEVIRASMKDKEEAMRAAVKEDEENNRQRDAQRQQREKQRMEAERKKEERAKKKAMGRRGDVWGAGTLGGATDDGNDFDDE